MTVRTRFAPSPTGSLHVGGARTALYCLLHARKHDGVFLLRIEDTDRRRSTEEAAVGILRDLEWLGLQWDEGPGRGGDAGPYFQSERLDLYDEHLELLRAKGRVYEAWDSREELGARRDAAMAAKENFVYRRPSWTDEQVEAFRAEGREPVLRFTAPDHDVTVDDVILGPVTIAEAELDDIVVRKADGFPTYHFAVVVDDHHMGVSLVLRGQEHLRNTHKHLGLYEAMGWEPPQHGHMPLIFNLDGSKMSKRDKAKTARVGARQARDARGEKGWEWLAEATGLELDDLTRFMKKKHDSIETAETIARTLDVELPLIDVLDYRKAGYLPEGVLNYLALLGWASGDDRELYTLPELIEAFDVARVNKTAAKFDPVKCAAVNAEHIRAASVDRLLEVMDLWLEVAPDSAFHAVDVPTRRRLLELYQPRIHTLSDLEAQAHFFLAAPTTWDDKAVKKHLTKGGGFDRLRGLRDVLDGVDTWEEATLQGALEAWAEAHELGLGKVAQPLRVAVSGAGVSPGIYETLALLGRDAVLSRIDACLAAHPED